MKKWVSPSGQREQLLPLLQSLVEREPALANTRSLFRFSEYIHRIQVNQSWRRKSFRLPPLPFPSVFLCVPLCEQKRLAQDYGRLPAATILLVARTANPGGSNLAAKDSLTGAAAFSATPPLSLLL